MIRSTVLVALTLLASTAHAADKRGPAPAPAAPPPQVEQAPPKPAFSGLYIGATVGHATGTIRDGDGFSFPREGYSVGGLVGYNHRLPGVPALVLGAEADLAVTDVSGSSNPGGGFTVSGSSRYLGGARVRLGMPVDQVMLYVTAGPSVTNGRVGVTGIGAGDKASIYGLSAGGGIEAFMFQNVGVRIEGLHTRWNDTSFNVDGLETGKLKSTETAVRAGLIVRLN